MNGSFFESEFFKNLKREAEANPTLVMGVGAGLIGAVAKLVEVSVKSRNSVSWRRETRRREMKDRRR